MFQLARHLSEKGLRVWLDKDELPPGQNWQPLIENGLQNSKAVAVCFGREGEGPWQVEEMEGALRIALRENRPVIPILLPTASRKPELPMFISNRTWSDCRNGFGDDEIAGIQWGITGVNPREEKLGVAADASEKVLSPEERLSEVFGPVYGSLKNILKGNEELRKTLSEHFELPNDDSSDTVAKMIAAFHVNYLEALAMFLKINDGEWTDSESILELVSHTMFLSMCPEVAKEFADSEDGKKLEIPIDASQGITEMLLAWKRGKGGVPVPSKHLLREKRQELWETPPILAVDAVKSELKSRFGIDQNSKDADRILKARLKLQKLRDDPELFTVEHRGEGDDAVIEDLQKSDVLTDLIVLIKKPRFSINPKVSAELETGDYELQFEVFLSFLLSNLSQEISK